MPTPAKAQRIQSSRHPHTFPSPPKPSGPSRVNLSPLTSASANPGPNRPCLAQAAPVDKPTDAPLQHTPSPAASETRAITHTHTHTLSLSLSLSQGGEKLQGTCQCLISSCRTTSPPLKRHTSINDRQSFVCTTRCRSHAMPRYATLCKSGW